MKARERSIPDGENAPPGIRFGTNAAVTSCSPTSRDRDADQFPLATSDGDGDEQDPDPDDEYGPEVAGGVLRAGPNASIRASDPGS